MESLLIYWLNVDRAYLRNADLLYEIQLDQQWFWSSWISGGEFEGCVLKIITVNSSGTKAKVRKEYAQV